MSAQFPAQDGWIPNRQQIFVTKAAVMEIVGGALDAFGRSEAYGRRVITHGDTGQVLPSVGNIIVTNLGVFPGRAGAQLFQFEMEGAGGFGKLAQRFGRFRILMATPWKSVEASGYGGGLVEVDELASQTLDVDTDGWIVYSALLASSLGGVVVDPPLSRVSQDNKLFAQMLPYGPEGQMAGWEIIFEVQL